MNGDYFRESQKVSIKSLSWVFRPIQVRVFRLTVSFRNFPALRLKLSWRRLKLANLIPFLNTQQSRQFVEHICTQSEKTG